MLDSGVNNRYVQQMIPESWCSVNITTTQPMRHMERKAEHSTWSLRLWHMAHHQVQVGGRTKVKWRLITTHMNEAEISYAVVSGDGSNLICSAWFLTESEYSRILTLSFLEPCSTRIHESPPCLGCTLSHPLLLQLPALVSCPHLASWSFCGTIYPSREVNQSSQRAIKNIQHLHRLQKGDSPSCVTCMSRPCGNDLVHWQHRGVTRSALVS
jgi:hypothetical protein